jgi:hypothetical protein
LEPEDLLLSSFWFFHFLYPHGNSRGITGRGGYLHLLVVLPFNKVAKEEWFK